MTQHLLNSKARAREIYRGPSINVNLFNEAYGKILHSIANESKGDIVDADQNIDLLKVQEHPGKAYVLDMTFYGVTPTRITHANRSLLLLYISYYIINTYVLLSLILRHLSVEKIRFRHASASK